MQGIEDLLQQAAILPSEISLITHGTTLATNALIERRGAKTARSYPHHIGRRR